MSGDKYRRDPCRHERDRCDNRSYREPRNSAHAMPGGTAVAPHRAEANQETRERKDGGVALNGLRRQVSACQQYEDGRCNEPGNESKATCKFSVLVGWKQARGDAAD